MIHYLGNHLRVGSREAKVNAGHIFLVSRNPYSRLYAAYIDRVFLPAMQSYSQRIAKKNNKTKGKEVSFEEFLQDATTNLLSDRPVDFHWQPLFHMCEPCIVPYDIIANQESFSQDIEYIISNLNVTEEFRSSVTESLYQHRTSNSIKEITKEMFPLAVDPKGLFGHTFLEFCERLWESYKIQGYIRSSFRFPVNKFKMLNYSSLNEALNIYLHFSTISNMTYTESKGQRSYYLYDAYKRVSRQTVIQIQKAYYLDFILFDYDMEPP
ncbi:hypothetical protein FSP39_004780 [Pinctada imbricata]|uniref:Carbohydrate sulfotransferase n=1 Tax=Pinctada imbricata TaxID=66713 RepID=A0AA88YHB6_PINIB|nr:hypothetical protein FSP39_004780 [Pinctada imbricata]